VQVVPHNAECRDRARREHNTIARDTFSLAVHTISMHLQMGLAVHVCILQMFKRPWHYNTTPKWFSMA
jgi:hypothetical protein